MPHRMQLTQNAQFLKASIQISDAVISSILTCAVSNRKPGTADVVLIERERRSTPHSNTDYLISVRVFQSERKVYFFDSSLVDDIYAFIVIYEFGDTVAIFKKSCGNISEALEDNFELAPPSDLTSTFDDNLADYQKISLRNMTISEKALRSRSYEAADLKGLLSAHAAGRSIPYYIKVRTGNTFKTISTNSARMVEMSERQSLDSISEWIHTQILLMSQQSGNKDFLDSFAKMVELKDVLKTASPSAILIESSSLIELLSELNAILSYKSRQGRVRVLSAKFQMDLFLLLEQVFEILPDGSILGHEKTARIRLNKKTITGTVRFFQRIAVHAEGKESNLLKFIIRNGLYSIVFDDPKYMYFMGHCFEDTSGVSEISSILDILEPKNELISSTSEKGGFSPSSTAFDTDSIFHAVESIHMSDDWIFCDDLGNEWADHITLNKTDTCIAFIHSKHGPLSNSASKLHDVVGQGIKNLGNLSFSVNQFQAKYQDKFASTYTNDRVQTKIQRVRKSPQGIQLDDYLKDLLKNYKLHRKCVLCCSFLSKSVLQAEFAKIQSGNKNIPGNITQLLWIISSFAHAAKDANAIPIIYCQP